MSGLDYLIELERKATALTTLTARAETLNEIITELFDLLDGLPLAQREQNRVDVLRKRYDGEAE